MTVAGEELKWPQGISTWIQVATTCIAVAGFLVMLGVSMGPIGLAPKRLDELTGRLAAIEYDNKTLERENMLLREHDNDSARERKDLYEKLSKVEMRVPNFLERNEFVEWKARLERDNPRLTAPPLIIKQ